ncbi:MFS transporter [Candidatus Bathyarchaeota archaeon]|nr:MFS transporter [Candidatus Bathyarchaeota archaeon]MBT4321137.1 MFS transporter [Candidatus Bathyarchaeota archaeon]MBT4424566.1 MFS transporter [Candidatus Bathyarchaeota archaeon]MBT5642791.1 MFS transporter [Candidatus Bathyarchaeota archaeon]MBT6604276.1 MFS transporter [Candidatus Bathyarchaeota archaeon]
MEPRGGEGMSGYDSRIYALMLAATTFVLNFTLIQPIYSLFLTSRGITVVQLGILLSIQSFIPLILRIPLSGVAERIGRLRTMIIGLFVSGVASVFFIYARTYTHFLLAIAVSSFTSSSFNQTAMSTVSDAAPPERQGDAMGRYLTFLGLGMLIGPAACSRLVESIGYTGLFWLSAIVPLFGIALLVFMAPTNIRERETRIREKPTISTADSMKMILRNRNVLLLSYCRASFSAAQSLFLALFSIYAVQQLGFSESVVAMLFTVRGFANMLSRYPAGSVSDRIGRKPLMLGAYGLLVVSFSMIAYTKSVLMLGMALGLYGICWGTRAVSEWAFLTDLVEPEIKTISISYLASVFSLGSTLGSIASGILTLYLPYSTIFLIGAALNLGSIPAILAMKKDS